MSNTSEVSEMSEDVSIELVVHNDPGHGYLAVPKNVYATVMGKDHRPTKCSFELEDTWLLEEDCDATMFVDAMSDKVGGFYNMTVSFHEVEHASRQALLRDAAKGCPCMNEGGV